MEKRHKQILKDKRPDLVESLNMIGGLFTQLISRDILDLRMVRTIKVCFPLLSLAGKVRTYFFKFSYSSH
jgi:hypothetical protein